MAEQYGIALPAMSAGDLGGRGEAADIPEVPLLQNRGGYQGPEDADGPTSESFIRDLIEAQKEEQLPRFGAQLFSKEVETYAPLGQSACALGLFVGAG